MTMGEEGIDRAQRAGWSRSISRVMAKIELLERQDVFGQRFAICIRDLGLCGHGAVDPKRRHTAVAGVFDSHILQRRYKPLLVNGVTSRAVEFLQHLGICESRSGRKQ